MRLLQSRLPYASCYFTVLVAILVTVSTVQAQRLPQAVKPEHYSLKLTPDLKNATFTGQESIDVVISQPVDGVTLNSAEIKFGTVTAKLGGKTLTAKVTEDVGKQQATFDFGQQLPAGKLHLSIDYTGILNDKLRGFYLSKTARRNYAVTQFESTDARRAFPSFDEPAFKATFDITLVVDKDDTAISNTNIAHDEPARDNAAKHAITFATTPRMSSYLVAFLVGDFKCLSGSSDGVPIRVCATPDQVQYGAFALSSAEYVLHYYNTYFGIKYPMPKLDMIALPDFEAGAMENFGAITYRETDLLLDSSHASVGAQRLVGLVVAHEMAHQWFGDMVTMQWWDNIWLNEGFASWMENKPIAAWKPEFNISQEVAQGQQDTLNLDAQRVTRTIRAKAETPDEINEMFDGISYGKAGAVLLMVENYVGEETFRQGVHKYLAAHLYGNATAEDFWTAQTEVSHKPVDKIMDSFISQPGEPIITLGSANQQGVPVSQRRFFLNANTKADERETWTIPVCFKLAGEAKCEVLSERQQSLPVSSSPLLFANAEGKGYYRSNYSDAMYDELVTHVESDLKPEERISLLGDEWALMRAGKASVGSYLNLVAAVRNDSSAEVLDAATGNLYTIDNRIAGSEEDRTRFSSWVRSRFVDAYRNLGEPQSSDSPGKRELRAILLNLVATLGNDPDAIADAKKLTAKSLADPASVDPTLSEAALKIAARNGDAALFERLQKLSLSAANPQTRSEALHALALFVDPLLEKRALDYAVSGEVKNQDSASLIGAELRGRDTREFAWSYIQGSWDKVIAQVTESSGAGIVASAGAFCTVERQQQVSSFFSAHKVPASERTLKRAEDQIGDCIDLRSAQSENLKAWLSKQ